MQLPFHLFNVISAVLPARCHVVRAWLLKGCGVAVGRNVCVGAAIRIYGRNLQIGDDTWLSSETAICTGADAPVTIGSRCDIGPSVWFITGSHSVGGPARRAGSGYSKPIVVGSGCWIGGRATILGGASIGEGSVVAAGAVVVPGVYPANVLLAGVPATVKKTLPLT